MAWSLFLFNQLDGFITSEVLDVTLRNIWGRFVARSSLFLTRSGAAITYLIPNRDTFCPAKNVTQDSKVYFATL